MKSKLITISACAGGGKTAITKALSKKVNPTSVYYFDEIDEKVIFPNNYPHAEADEYNLDQIITMIEKDKLNSHGLILFDFPFGRCHTKMNSLIDFAIFIDVPLDIAMSRRILRDVDIERLDLLPQLLAELKYYEPKGRNAYLNALKTIKPSCDWIVEGNEPIDQIISKIMKKIV